jgi:hypothetical protein
MVGALHPADLLAILLGLAVVIGCINYLWVGLPPAIGMLLGSLLFAAIIVSSDHILHLHIMRWFRGTSPPPTCRASSSTVCWRCFCSPAAFMSTSRSSTGGAG